MSTSETTSSVRFERLNNTNYAEWRLRMEGRSYPDRIMDADRTHCRHFDKGWSREGRIDDCDGI